jgi:hypothetical protein
MTTALWAIAAALAIIAVAVVVAAWIVTVRHAPRPLTDDEIRARLAPVTEPLFTWTHTGDKDQHQ